MPTRLADTLGDLPLALDQAAAYCDETGIGYGRYLALLEKGHGAKLRGRPIDYERTVAMTWEASFAQVKELSPAAAQLVDLCAFFAPDRIPPRGYPRRKASPAGAAENGGWRRCRL